MVNNAVTSVSIENDKYSFACGVGSFPACSGVTINTANTNTIEFVFNNTALSVVNGASQGITVKNGSLIHIQNVTQPSNTINLAACNTVNGTTGLQCGASVLADFSVTLRHATNNQSCTVTKKGAVLSMVSGALSASAQLDNELNDVALNPVNAVRQIQASTTLNGISTIVSLNFSSTGQFTSAITSSVGGGSPFICVP